MQISKSEDRKARRAAARAGFRIVKSRERQQHSNNRGGYQLLDAWTNIVKYGADFDISPADVLEICAAEGFQGEAGRGEARLGEAWRGYLLLSEGA